MKRLLVLPLFLAACGPSGSPVQIAPPAAPAAPSVDAAPSVVPPIASPVVARRLDIKFPDGSKLAAELALTPEERERGLMFRQAMKPEDGMLFVFEKNEALAFWMKNTFVDLDMVWMDDDRSVTVVHANVPKSKPGMTDEEVATRAGHGLYVLELASGQAAKRGIKVGGKLEFTLKPAVR